MRLLFRLLWPFMTVVHRLRSVLSLCRETACRSGTPELTSAACNCLAVNWKQRSALSHTELPRGGMPCRPRRWSVRLAVRLRPS